MERYLHWANQSGSVEYKEMSKINYLWKNTKCGTRIAASLNSNIISLIMPGQTESGFVSKHIFGCENFLILKFLKNVISKYVTNWFVLV